MTRATRRAALCLGGALFAAVPAAPADDPLPVGPGARVRLTASGSRDRLKGTVQSLEPTVLAVISDDHQLVRVPRATITRLETGWGRRGNAKKGLLIGGLAGAGAGLLGCALDTDGDQWPFDDELDTGCEGTEWVGVPVAAGLAYGGIGALIGHFIKTDRWVEVPVEGVRVSLATPRRGIGLAISVRF